MLEKSRVDSCSLVPKPPRYTPSSSSLWSFCTMKIRYTILLNLPEYLHVSLYGTRFTTLKMCINLRLQGICLGYQPTKRWNCFHWSRPRIKTPITCIFNATLLYEQRIRDYWVCPCNSYGEWDYCLANRTINRLSSKLNRQKHYKLRQSVSLITPSKPTKYQAIPIGPNNARCDIVHSSSAGSWFVWIFLRPAGAVRI